MVRLPDGRSIGFAEFGAPDGYPIVNAHGGLVCRLDVAAADGVAHLHYREILDALREP